MKLENGVEVELVECGFDTRVHCCAGCYFHENDIICDDYLVLPVVCSVTRVYKEIK